ncbi:MAG: outer membrane beta-barrel protein [Sideroxyarcus sp.]|nr:outer membrane beta-barrel protein [Sideroxyarcus sp.]
MAMRCKVWALTIICGSFALPAMADEALNSHNSYISISAGKSSSPGTCASSSAPGATCSEKGNVYRLGYGYHFTPNWGMEISYGDFGQAKEEGVYALPPPGVPGGGPVPYVWTWDAIGWEVAATGTLHFGNSLSLIGKLGFLRANVGQEYIINTTTNEVWHAVLHEASNNISSSVGAQYDFNEDFALRIQHDRFGKLGNLSKINVSATSASAILKF